MVTASSQESSAPGTAPAAKPFKVTKYTATIGATGEHFAFATSARTSADGLFRFVWTLAPGKRGPGEHTHQAERESFQIVSGRIRIWQRGVPKDYGPGDVCVVEPGVPHRFLNPGAEPVVINVSLNGTTMEDMLVPLGVATHGKDKPALRDLLRMMASMDGPASTPATAPARFSARAMAKAARLLGPGPFPPVIGWDAPDA